MGSNNVTWPGWETVRLIGRGSFGAVYEIERDVLGEREKAALKVISIPQNESDISEMYSDGYDDESITSTFKEHLKSIVAEEYSLMRKLNGSSNVVNCDDVRYVQHDDGIGWDIFIRVELLTPLTDALPAEIPEEQVLKIAKDLCRALVQCKQFGIVHRDIKPQNIFVSPLGDYKLGDFGIAKTVEKTSGGTKIGTYKYMAPEVYNNQPYGAGADIYSLGLVLYWLLNERRMPFLPLPPEKLRAGMEEQARLRRFSGELIPAPAHGSDELKRIVLKACAFDPKDRFQSAEEMLRDLANINVRQFRDPTVASTEGDIPQSITAGHNAENTIGIFKANKTILSMSQVESAGTERSSENVDISIVQVTQDQMNEDDKTVGVFDYAKRDSGDAQSLKQRSKSGGWRFGVGMVAVIVLVIGVLFLKQLNIKKEASEAASQSVQHEDGKDISLLTKESTTIYNPEAAWASEWERDSYTLYEYNSAGSRIKETTYTPDGTVLISKETFYDDQGRRAGYSRVPNYELFPGYTFSISEEYSYIGESETPSESTRRMNHGLVIHDTYDPHGNVILEECSWESGELTSSTEYEYEYNDAGDKTSRQYYVNGERQRVTYEYDNSGKLVLEQNYEGDTLAHSQVSIYRNGTLIRQEMYNGDAFHFDGYPYISYKEGLGFLECVVEYEYDEYSNLSQKTYFCSADSLNNTNPDAITTYEYIKRDESGETFANPNNDFPTSMHYYEENYYDHAYILDYTLRFAFDSDGRIATVSNYNSSGDMVAVVNQEYDADGNCTKTYDLATSKNELLLEWYHQDWEDGRLVRTERSDGMYSQEYIYDENGKLSVTYFYENELLYMEDVYTYDALGRINNIVRTNYGKWSFIIEYSYEENSEKPNSIKWGESGYYLYEYEYDDADRLICEKETYYSGDKLSSITTKTYEYAKSE